MCNKAKMVLEMVLHAVYTILVVLLLNTHVRFVSCQHATHPTSAAQRPQLISKHCCRTAGVLLCTQSFCAYRQKITTENKDVYYNSFLSSSAHHYLGAELCSECLVWKNSAVCNASLGFIVKLLNGFCLGLEYNFQHLKRKLYFLFLIIGGGVQVIKEARDLYSLELELWEVSVIPVWALNHLAFSPVPSNKV